jgi:hypothetical protein
MPPRFFKHSLHNFISINRLHEQDIRPSAKQRRCPSDPNSIKAAIYQGELMKAWCLRLDLAFGNPDGGTSRHRKPSRKASVKK